MSENLPANIVDYSSLRSNLSPDVLAIAAENQQNGSFLPSIRIIQKMTNDVHKYGMTTDAEGKPIPKWGWLLFKDQAFESLTVIPLTERPAAYKFSSDGKTIIASTTDAKSQTFKEIAAVKKNKSYVSGVEVMLWVVGHGLARFMLKSTGLDKLENFIQARTYVCDMTTEKIEHSSNTWWNPLLNMKRSEAGSLVRCEDIEDFPPFEQLQPDLNKFLEVYDSATKKPETGGNKNAAPPPDDVPF